MTTSHAIMGATPLGIVTGLTLGVGSVTLLNTRLLLAWRKRVGPAAEAQRR